MFEDSEIVKKFSMGRTKATHMIIFGLVPYFKDELIKLLPCSAFVVCFYEALNRVIQQVQMGIFIRYYYDQSGMVMARYFGSAFWGHSTAFDLFASWKKGLGKLELKEILQISMDEQRGIVN